MDPQAVATTTFRRAITKVIKRLYVGSKKVLARLRVTCVHAAGIAIHSHHSRKKTWLHSPKQNETPGSYGPGGGFVRIWHRVAMVQIVCCGSLSCHGSPSSCHNNVSKGHNQVTNRLYVGSKKVLAMLHVTCVHAAGIAVIRDH